MPYFTGESILRRLNETNVYNKHRQCYIFTWVKKIMWDATIMLTITRCFENWLMTFYLTLYNFQTCLSEVALAKNQWCFLVECFQDSFISTSMLRWYSFFFFYLIVRKLIWATKWATLGNCEIIVATWERIIITPWSKIAKHMSPVITGKTIGDIDYFYLDHFFQETWKFIASDVKNLQYCISKYHPGKKNISLTSVESTC